MITNILILLAIVTILICLALRERRKTVGKLYWHIHHDQLLEMATEPIARHRKYIVISKAVDEIKTRLRYLKPVKGILPAEVVGAFRFHTGFVENLRKVWEFYWHVKRGDRTGRRKMFEQLHESRDKADADLRVTLQKYESEINRLHREECSCPWNGITLFPAALSDAGLQKTQKTI